MMVVLAVGDNVQFVKQRVGGSIGTCPAAGTVAGGRPAGPRPSIEEGSASWTTVLCCAVLILAVKVRGHDTKW